MNITSNFDAYIYRIEHNNLIFITKNKRRIMKKKRKEREREIRRQRFVLYLLYYIIFWLFDIGVPWTDPNLCFSCVSLEYSQQFAKKNRYIFAYDSSTHRFSELVK